MITLLSPQSCTILLLGPLGFSVQFNPPPPAPLNLKTKLSQPLTSTESDVGPIWVMGLSSSGLEV